MKKMTLEPVRKLTGVVIRAFGPIAAEYHEKNLIENDALYDEYCYSSNSVECHTFWLYSQLGGDYTAIDRIFLGMVREAAFIAGVSVREVLDHLDREDYADRDLLIESLWAYMYAHYMACDPDNVAYYQRYLRLHGFSTMLAAHLRIWAYNDFDLWQVAEFKPFWEYENE